MNGPLALTATFVAVPVYSLAPGVVGGGSVILVAARRILQPRHRRHGDGR